jgi:hypothetical protein
MGIHFEMQSCSSAENFLLLDYERSYLEFPRVD